MVLNKTNNFKPKFFSSFQPESVRSPDSGEHFLHRWRFKMKTINKINVEFLLVIERLYYFAKFILSMKFIFTKNIQNAA